MQQSIDVRTPDTGLGDDAYVFEVSVAVGQTVAREQAVVTIETQKGSVEIPAPAAGRVTQVLAVRNATVQHAELLVVLEPLESEQLQPALNPVSAARPESSLVSGSGAEPGTDFHASPWIRSLARERGLDLGELVATGRHGRILEEDLVRHAPIAPQPRSLHSELPAPDAAEERTERRPLSRLQRTVAGNLAKNWAQIPHVTQFDEADITELEAFRDALNRERQKQGPKLSLLPFVVKACASALAAFPEFNGSLVAESLILKHEIKIGFAVDTTDGLRVPVIQHADRLSLLQIAQEIARLAERARASKLTPTDVQGGTFTISNLGGAGGTAFTPIINAPELAILGVSKAELKPKWNGSAFVPRLMLPLSLSYDHRVLNGVAGARFVAHLGSVLSDLRRALL